MTTYKSLTLETFTTEIHHIFDHSASMYLQAKEEIYTVRQLFRISGNHRFVAWMEWLDRIFELNAKEAIKHLDHYLEHSDVDKITLLMHASAFIQALAEPPEYVIFLINMLCVDDYFNEITFRKKLKHLHDRAEIILAPYEYLVPPDPEPEPRIMLNNTIVGSHIYGSVTQVGGNVSSGPTELDLQAIRCAVKDAILELERSANSQEVRNLAADVSTINSQLEKSSFSRPILVEACASIRAMIENIAAGLLTPGAGAALERVIGLLSKM